MPEGKHIHASWQPHLHPSPLDAGVHPLQPSRSQNEVIRGFRHHIRFNKIPKSSDLQAQLGRLPKDFPVVASCNSEFSLAAVVPQAGANREFP